MHRALCNVHRKSTAQGCLQAGKGELAVESVCVRVPRISVSRLGGTQDRDSDALDSAVLDAIRQGIQHTVLSRTRLRRGGQAQKVSLAMLCTLVHCYPFAAESGTCLCKCAAAAVNVVQSVQDGKMT